MSTQVSSTRRVTQTTVQQTDIRILTTHRMFELLVKMYTLPWTLSTHTPIGYDRAASVANKPSPESSLTPYLPAKRLTIPAVKTVGATVGARVTNKVGNDDGCLVGCALGEPVGCDDGFLGPMAYDVGVVVGWEVGNGGPRYIVTVRTT